MEDTSIKFIKNSDQSGKAGIVIFIFILLVLATVGFKIGKTYLDNETVNNLTEEMAERALLEIGYDFPSNVVNTLKKYDISIKPEEIKFNINERHDQIHVSFNYTNNADLIVTRIPMTFRIDFTKEEAKARTVLDNFQNDLEGGSRGSSERALDDIKSKLNR